MQAIRVPPLNERQRRGLDALYRQSKDPRLRTRVPVVFLFAVQRFKVPKIVLIVRESEATVLRWLKRFIAEGANRRAPRRRTSHHVSRCGRGSSAGGVKRYVSGRRV